MAHKYGLEALDRTLKDIRNNNELMGGIVVVLAGDFRQTLPVVPRGTMADEIKACLKSSQLWNKINILQLKTNMRVHLFGDLSSGEFAQTQLDIGEGRIRPVEGLIEFPTNFCNTVDSLESLKESVFSDLKTNFKNHAWLFERAILALKYKSVNKLNIDLLEILPEQPRTYLSIDSTVKTEEAVNYPVEFLNSLDPPGMPLHNLTLKVGEP
ncbi:ATP-dependent DNA helicase Pif1-like [Arctopsyche grandis]|uniref:ATP-dependent DNA helicase Pif1-like n=1 Tax=Arctopsyche grandis TaxID=121162 RepID=UPI00406D872E